MSTIALLRQTTSALSRAFRRRRWCRLWLTIVLAVAGTASQVVVPILIQQMTDNEILGEGGVDIEGALTLGGIALLAIAVGCCAAGIGAARHLVGYGTRRPQGWHLPPSPPTVDAPRPVAAPRPRGAGDIGPGNHPGLHGLGRRGDAGRIGAGGLASP